MSHWWLIPAGCCASFVLTGLLRKYALARQLIDVPNTRSSHTVATPRGGGGAIVFTFLVALMILFQMELISTGSFSALGGAGALVALVGFIDDHGHIAARWRLAGHFLAGIWVLFWVGGMPVLSLFGFILESGWITTTLALFYLVWVLNLYNFMDGIDGLASVEAICACLGICVLYWVTGHGDLVWPPLLLAVSVTGFLIWNFPPAKIFMGDAGSGFLGIVLGVFSLQAAWASPDFFWAWLILLGVFIVDSTFTLIRRLARGEKIYQAHRSHAYQFAARQFGHHLPVTLAVGAINLFWLVPLAFCVVRFRMDGAMVLCIAYAPLLVLALKFHAGERERQADFR
ncbi:glycosyltransferase family 4 protein [Pseudomonas sp. P66]|uniref:Glycosyltransferase family 4 protein n=1 Tax=Pseudomonas arcuscaelestis TaxID=2710591 RepID=A0ABS2C8C0_9PSED|nr:glycosyltransferase family 4 protein [Pseudomonas arcuscaelestis]MBM5461588.1 glycosyltransferase family 4 protein [Pseudomonas arcuscaelestis]